MKNTIALILGICLCLPVSGQSRSETRHYEGAVAEDSIDAYNSFIRKYPRSTYLPEILARKDTLLNICPYSLEDACEIARRFMGPDAQVVARATRNNAVDYLEAAGVNADSLAFGSMRVISLEKPVKSDWTVKYSYDVVLLDTEDYDTVNLVDDYDIDRISSKDNFIFSCIFAQKQGPERMFMELAYCPEDDKVSKIFFLGKDILTDGESGYHILGRQIATAPQESPEISYLLNRVKNNNRLEVVSNEDYYTDEAIRFWLEHNPDAMTSATKITASVLPKKSSLVEKYNSSKKVSNSKFNVAQVTFRGYTMIVAYQKSGGQYILFWVEPECKDRNTGRLLNNISFRDGSNLEMYYYQGNKYFKYSLNLESKAIRR